MGRANQHYMTEEERYQLEALLKAKVSITKIAKQLGFCRQTIYNEIKRGTYLHTYKAWDKPAYSAQKGQIVSEYNQSNKGRPLKIGKDHAYANYLEAKIMGVQEDGSIDRRKRYSPAAALACARNEGFKTRICTATLYSYIDKGIFLRLTNRDLWEKSKRKKRRYKNVQRIANPGLPSISNRPKYINRREEPGHWEIDLVVGKSRSTPALLVLTERVSREEIIVKLRDKKAETVRAALRKLRRKGYVFRSITTDNGPEFLEYDALAAALPGTEFYYCHSYASWEKGTVENQNRMIRRWYPKGTNFTTVKQEEITDLQEWMNRYPRRSLGWMCAGAYAEMAGTRCG